MKNFTKVIALILAMAMVLSGCMVENDDITINADGTAKMIQTVTIDKEQADTNLKSMGYTDPEAFMTSMSDTETKYEVVTKEDGKQYYELVTETKYDTLAEFGSESVGTFTNGVYATVDTIYGVTSFEDMKAEAEMTGQDISTVMTYTMTLEFSKPIVATTGTIDAENPNKATFNIPVDKASTVFATTNSANTLETVKKKVDASNTIKKPKIKSAKVTKIKGKKANVTVKIKKMKGVKFYVECATNKKFTKNYKSKVTKKTKVVFKKLKAGKKYYFRVYAYKENYCGVEIGKNSKRKTVKIPKKAKKAKKK